MKTVNCRTAIGIVQCPIPEWQCDTCGAIIDTHPESDRDFTDALHLSTVANRACGGRLHRVTAP